MPPSCLAAVGFLTCIELRTKTSCHSFKVWHDGFLTLTSSSSCPVPYTYQCLHKIFRADFLRVNTLVIGKGCPGFKIKFHWNPTLSIHLHMAYCCSLCLRRKTKECDRDRCRKAKILSGSLQKNIYSNSLGLVFFNHASGLLIFKSHFKHHHFFKWP